MVQRLLRLSDSSYSIAAGFACGAAVSFTPFIGFHILLAIALAHLLRSNVLAAIIGTAVGNPWTFPFIFVLLYRVGTAVMPLIGFDDTISAQLDISDSAGGFDLSVLAEYILPMAFGGAVIAGNMAGIFGASYLMIAGWRNHKMKRRMQKHHKRNNADNIASSETE